MSSLADFILARVAEDEEAARRYSVQHWRKVDDYTVANDPGVVGTVLPDAEHGWGVARTATVRDAEFIAQHDPARVLRQCEAIRELVDDFNVLDADYKVSHLETAEGRRFQALVAMSRAASIWSDHPDYRDEWRP